MPTILQLQFSRHLASLLRNSDAVHDSLLFALEAISEWPAGVAALAENIDDELLERLEELSHDQSLDLASRTQTRKILDHITWHAAGKRSLATWCSLPL
ncbi:hypothetical protein K438DRAFT_1718453 [Mycena galopus ATCC 62051]|nr:hypothetical protein K438DRAFT_1718453 [Mycena galopus ATCC 62051]